MWGKLAAGPRLGPWGVAFAALGFTEEGMGVMKFEFGKVKNYVGGEWVNSTGRESFDVTNPATLRRSARSRSGRPPTSTPPSRPPRRRSRRWSDVPVANRARYLFDLRNVMVEHYDELCELCTQEHGKTLEESKGDVGRGIENVETAAGMPSLMMGQALEQIATRHRLRERAPADGRLRGHRPVQLPLDGPVLVSAVRDRDRQHRGREAERAGAVLEQRLFELIDEKLKLPTGVLNMVNGGRDVVNGILDHKDIAGVSFVGSTPVAEHVYARCGATGKRVQALGGAKNFTLVTDDCVWEKTLPNIIDSAFGVRRPALPRDERRRRRRPAYGKLETSSSRGAQGDQGRLRHGEGVTMGPVISAAHKERVVSYIEKRRQGGGRAPRRRPQLQGRRLPEGALHRPHGLREGLAVDGDRQRGDLRPGPLPARGHHARRGDPRWRSSTRSQRGLHLHVRTAPRRASSPARSTRRWSA